MEAAEDRVIEHHGRVMGSELHIIAVGADDRIVGEAGAQLERLECLWTRFSGGSDIARINTADGAAVAVAPETLHLVARMIEGWHLTDGRFDPTTLRALMHLGDDASRDDPKRRTVLGPFRCGRRSLDAVRIDPQRSTVTVPPGLVLDAGGIGKGLAADLTVASMLASGARGALISIGGDLAMAGAAPDPDGWIVEVEHARPDDGILCALSIDAGGVATSSTVSRRWSAGGVEVHHCIDPSTGEPSDTDLVCVTVIASSGWEAEVHATAALLVGTEGVLRHLDRHGLTGVAIATDGRVLRTGDLRTLVLNMAGSIR